MNKQNLSIGIMSADIQTPGGEFQIFPAGEFRAKDGRPTNADAYRLGKEEAMNLIAAFEAQKNPIVVDYEHQAIFTKQNGKPAPAAGWVHGLEWREGKGLYAVGVKWTEAAKAAIQADEYRYISPVFNYAQGTGEVLSLFNVALTNTPGLDGMEAAVAHSLNHGPAPEAGELEALRQNIETARGTLAAILEETEALKARQSGEEVELVIQGYCDAGKLTPGELESARKLGRFDLAALRQMIEPRGSLFVMQSERLGLHQQGKPASPLTAASLTAADLRACELTGRKPEEFAALKAQFFNETPNSLED